eukprot:COSAG01_NODE_6633_length_3569_cov_13.963689_2_plen_518_part_00
MGDLVAWLGAIHKTCSALATPLDDEYGIDEVEDLVNLEPGHIDHLVDMLKMNPGKKFRKAVEALQLRAASPPGNAGGAGLGASISEDVPPDKPIDLHAVGTLSSDPGSVDDEPFFSLRFGATHGVVPMAKQLQGALARRGTQARIIDMMAGGDIDTTVFSSIEECGTFVVFGSAHYGEDTGNQACTFYEYKHAFGLKKRIILIRMIPFDQEFEELQARVIFNANKLVIPWMLGTPMPPDLPEQILQAMGKVVVDAGPVNEPEPEMAVPGMEVALVAERARLQAQVAQLQADKAQVQEQAAQLQRQQSEVRRQTEALSSQSKPRATPMVPAGKVFVLAHADIALSDGGRVATRESASKPRWAAAVCGGVMDAAYGPYRAEFRVASMPASGEMMFGLARATADPVSITAKGLYATGDGWFYHGNRGNHYHGDHDPHRAGLGTNPIPWSGQQPLAGAGTTIGMELMKGELRVYRRLPLDSQPVFQQTNFLGVMCRQIWGEVRWATELLFQRNAVHVRVLS